MEAPLTRLAQTQLQNKLLPSSQQAPPEASPPVSPEQQAPPEPAGIEVPEFDPEKILSELWDTVLDFADALATPWAFLQLLVVLLCFGLARFISNQVTPPLEERLRHIESQPQLQRTLVIPLRRLTGILFALFLWIAAYSLREVTWPSHGYYVGLAATLATVGIVISVISRFIRNRSLATLFTYSTWAVAGLHIMGLLNEALLALDAVAFSIGDFRLSIFAMLKAVLFLTILIWLATIVGNFLERRLRQNEDLAPALQVLLAKFIKFTLLTIAVLGTISAVGIDLTALTVFSGALGLGIGFGLQKIASNLISGIIILSDNSIKPGDVITLGDTFGWINSLNSRYVSVITRDGLEYLIPNESFVSERVVNWSHSNKNVRVEIKFGVSYDSDPHKVRQIASDAILNLERALDRPAPVCHIVDFGDSSIDFVLRFWIRDPKNGLTNIRGAAYLALWDAFKAHGIEIPYPHRQLIFPDATAAASATGKSRRAKPKARRAASARSKN
jgi:small-conductance mechanosensitive channel